MQADPIFNLQRTDTTLTLTYDAPPLFVSNRMNIDGVRITWCLEDVGLANEDDDPREVIFETPYGDVHVQSDDPAFAYWLPALILGSLDDALKSIA